MAKITNLSVRTLRYYDKIGLIVPEIRNEDTNYRYYSNAQMLQLQILKELRTLDFSLEEIRNIIYNKNTDNLNHLHLLKSKLEQKVDFLDNEMNKLKMKVKAVHNAYNQLTQGLNLLALHSTDRHQLYINETYENEIFRLPKISALCIRKYSPLNAKQLFLDRYFELQQLLEKYNLYQAGGGIGIFHDGFEAQFNNAYGDLELCLPFIKPEDFDCECKEQKILGGSLVASTVHVGHYKNAYKKYLSLIGWINRTGYKIVGPSMEFYILEPAHSMDSNFYTTRLCFPIEDCCSVV